MEYNAENRGKIQNDKSARRLNLFDGLIYYGSKGLTDIDGFMEFDDKAFIFIETKKAGEKLPYGQELALKRLTDACSVSKPAIVLLATHNSDSDIIVKNCSVESYYYKKAWDSLPHTLNVYQFIKYLLEIIVAKFGRMNHPDDCDLKFELMAHFVAHELSKLHKPLWSDKYKELTASYNFVDMEAFKRRVWYVLKSIYKNAEKLNQTKTTT